MNFLRTKMFNDVCKIRTLANELYRCIESTHVTPHQTEIKPNDNIDKDEYNE